MLRKLENAEALPLIALEALPELRADLDALEAEALLRARELGAPLEDIAEALAITRQGVADKLKALVGNGGDHEDEAEEADVVEVTDEADEGVIDVRAPHTDDRGPEIDFRRPHTKA